MKLDVEIINKALSYIGSKLDALSRSQEDNTRKLVSEIRDSKSKVELDLTTRAIEKLQDTSEININKVALALQAVAESEGKRLQELTRVITELNEAVKSETSDTQLLRSQGTKLDTLTNIFKEVSKKLDSSAKASDIKDIVSAVKDIKFEQKDTDLSPVVDGLKSLSDSISALRNDVAKNSPSNLEKLMASVSQGLSKLKLEVPKTFKLDEMQAREIRTGGGGLGSGPRIASKVTVANVALTATDTEYSYSFPANTISFTLKLREQDSLLYYSFTTGKLPTSGDASAYATLGQNFFQSQDNVEWDGKTIYLGSDTASRNAEIISYQM